MLDRYDGSVLDVLNERTNRLASTTSLDHLQWAIEMAILCRNLIEFLGLKPLGELHRLGVIHRDVAARNFLIEKYVVTQDREDKVKK